MPDLTREELAELLRKLAAANPGRWQSMRDGNQYIRTGYMPTSQLVGASRIDGPVRPWNPHAYLAHGFKPAEFETVRFTDEVADLVAALVNAAPQLIAMAEHMEELRAELGLTRTNLVRAFTDKASARELPTSKLAQLLAERTAGDLSPSLEQLRFKGWMVAEHYDYRVNEQTYTFWRFTRGDHRCVTGVAHTDAEALAQIHRRVGAHDAQCAAVDARPENTAALCVCGHPEMHHFNDADGVITDGACRNGRWSGVFCPCEQFQPSAGPSTKGPNQ